MCGQRKNSFLFLFFYEKHLVKRFDEIFLYKEKIEYFWLFYSVLFIFIYTETLK
jgi:hypothetical protein